MINLVKPIKKQNNYLKISLKTPEKKFRRFCTTLQKNYHYNLQSKTGISNQVLASGPIDSSTIMASLDLKREPQPTAHFCWYRPNTDQKNKQHCANVF